MIVDINSYFFKIRTPEIFFCVRSWPEGQMYLPIFYNSMLYLIFNIILCYKMHSKHGPKASVEWKYAPGCCLYDEWPQ